VVKRIVLYGKSVFIAGLAATLSSHPGLDLYYRDNDSLDDFPPADVIMADVAEIETFQALSNLCARSGMILVGVDTSANTLTVLTGKSHPANSMQDVLDVLKGNFPTT
jgi:hypothetical protein